MDSYYCSDTNNIYVVFCRQLEMIELRLNQLNQRYQFINRSTNPPSTDGYSLILEQIIPMKEDAVIDIGVDHSTIYLHWGRDRVKTTKLNIKTCSIIGTRDETTQRFYSGKAIIAAGFYLDTSTTIYTPDFHLDGYYYYDSSYHLRWTTERVFHQGSTPFVVREIPEVAECGYYGFSITNLHDGRTKNVLTKHRSNDFFIFVGELYYRYQGKVYHAITGRCSEKLSLFSSRWCCVSESLIYFINDNYVYSFGYKGISHTIDSSMSSTVMTVK